MFDTDGSSSTSKGWLTSVANRRSPSSSPPSSSNVKKDDKNEGSDSTSSETLDAIMEAVRAGVMKGKGCHFPDMG
ncbi:hypothetical protein L2E82_37459 [Cichorium intybus]|uniref:Uncharacterized protein n=1 Tax=Cichorium intybus TaxID=13427 RepID=A0ACB9ADJ9_CICIN|nr:hypothetical protein L2E82_37459 [Cichorium intybus]